MLSTSLMGQALGVAEFRHWSSRSLGMGSLLRAVERMTSSPPSQVKISAPNTGQLRPLPSTPRGPKFGSV
jgi:hypothetical protein